MALRFPGLMGTWGYRAKEDYVAAHADVQWWEGHLNNMILDEYQEVLGGSMADFGCNHGACTILAARNPRVNEIVGFDMNARAISRASQLLAESHEDPATVRKVSFAIAQLSAIPWPSDYFDSGIMFHVLEHIYPHDRQRVLAEIVRVMKNQASLVVVVPYERAYDDGFQHVAYFSAGSLTAALVALGLDVRDCRRDQRRDQHTPRRARLPDCVVQNRQMIRAACRLTNRLLRGMPRRVLNRFLKPRPRLRTSDVRAEALASFLRQNAAGYFASFACSLHDEQHGPNERLIRTAIAAAARAFEIDLRQALPFPQDANGPTPEWAKYVNVHPGEHYRLLAALVEVLQPQVVVDIGTFRGLSALAMKSRLPECGLLVTYDIVPWDQVVDTALTPADFDGRMRQRVCDLSTRPVAQEDLDVLRRAELILVDAAKDWTMEQRLCTVFETVPLRRDAIVVFDDIRMLAMIELWRRISHPKLDLTSFGHWSGTGLVEWQPM